MRGRHRRAALRALPTSVLTILSLATLGCGKDEPPADTAEAVQAPTGEVPIVVPDLSGATPAVRRQIGERQATLDRLRAAEDTPDGKLAEAYGELGTALFAYQLYAAAETALVNAHWLAPDELRWTYLLGYLYTLRGDPRRAATLLSAALEIAPDLVPALIRLGRLRVDAGQVAEARGLFERALEIAPRSAAAYEGLGRVATATGDHAGAVRHLRHALELAPDASSLRYLLGQSLRRLGDVEAAQRELARSGDVPVPLPDPMVQAIGGQAASAQFFIVQGSELLTDGDVESAVGSFRRAVELEPDNFVAHKGLAYSLEKLGDLPAAVQQLRKALESADEPAEQAEGHAILGTLMVTIGNDDEAAVQLESSLAVDPNQPATRLKLADTMARLGRFAEALAAYDRLLDELDDTTSVRVRRATALVNLGRHDEALAEFRRAVSGAPADPDVRLRYAEALDYLDRSGEADQQRAEARRLSAQRDGKGDQVSLLAGEGRLRTGSGDYAGAVGKYRQALELDPSRTDIRLALAAVLGHLQRYDEALEHYRSVIEAEPELVAARHGEIAALVLSGRYGHARVRLHEALRRFSRDKGLALTQARLLAACPDPRVRDGALALEVARRVHTVDAGMLARDTLAMALAEAGQVDRAAEMQRSVLADAASNTDSNATERLSQRLRAYEAGRPWHATPAEAEELLALRENAGGARAPD